MSKSTEEIERIAQREASVRRWAAIQKRHDDILKKLEIASDEGSELGEGCHAIRELLDNSSAALCLSDKIIEDLWDDAERTCDAYFQQIVDEANDQLSHGVAYDEVMELIGINEQFAKAGLPELWPEGFTKPSNEELEALGRCSDHPWETYRYRIPTNGCDRCIRLYVKEQDEIAAEKASKS